MERNRSKTLADQFLWEHKVSRITLDNLLFFIEERGFEVIDFSTNDNSSSTNAIFEQLGVDHLSECNSAFLYSNGELRYVFINEELDETEKLYALAHEFGHLQCGHVSFGPFTHGTFEQEHQANEFAHYLLHPSAKHFVHTWIYEHKLLTIIIGIVLLLCIASIPVTQYVQSKKYHDYYYVTDGGEHYHLEGCYYIQGKDAHRMTEEEFDSGKYTPCKICFH